MIETNEQDRPMDWDDTEAVDDGSGFVLLPEGTYPHQLPGGMCAILGSQVFLDERKKHMKEKACFCSFDVLS